MNTKIPITKWKYAHFLWKLFFFFCSSSLQKYFSAAKKKTAGNRKPRHETQTAAIKSKTIPTFDVKLAMSACKKKRSNEAG